MPILKIINLQFDINLSFLFVETHCIMKYLEVNSSVWATYKNTWAPQMRSNGADKNISQNMLQHNEKVIFEIRLWICNQYKFEKYVCSFVWHILFFETSQIQFYLTSSSIILYHNYLNKRKKYFAKIFSPCVYGSQV